ncbi:hypothetical protein ETB97_007351 [Aspergillus alliaceus]|uniref:Uncharacterized protein n=1 Tax=Petromyces alliaceus TaxID=209559 RepID=A0A8H6AB81_PETAA|nr:hypothetical protein ETB97_007351 [Aspergillus burnettii]
MVKDAPTLASIEDKVDGQRRLGHNPALVVREVRRQDFDAVKSQKAFRPWTAKTTALFFDFNAFSRNALDLWCSPSTALPDISFPEILGTEEIQPLEYGRTRDVASYALNSDQRITTDAVDNNCPPTQDGGEFATPADGAGELCGDQGGPGPATLVKEAHLLRDIVPNSKRMANNMILAPYLTSDGGAEGSIYRRSQALSTYFQVIRFCACCDNCGYPIMAFFVPSNFDDMLKQKPSRSLQLELLMALFLPTCFELIDEEDIHRTHQTEWADYLLQEFVETDSMTEQIIHWLILCDVKLVVFGGSGTISRRSPHVYDLGSWAYVAIFDIAEPADAIVEELPADRVKFYEGNIISTSNVEGSVQDVIEWSNETHAPLGGICCAGVLSPGKIIRSSFEPLALSTIRNAINISLVGTIDLVRQVVTRITRLLELVDLRTKANVGCSSWYLPLQSTMGNLVK